MKMSFSYENSNENAQEDVVLVLEYGKCTLHDILNCNRFLNNFLYLILPLRVIFY